MAFAFPCSSIPPETSKGVMIWSWESFGGEDWESFEGGSWDCWARERAVREGGWPDSSVAWETDAIFGSLDV